jgi:predicted transcriptional regulator
MAKICVNLPDDDKEAIEKLAAADERNISWIVRKAIQEYLKAHNNDDKEEE